MAEALTGRRQASSEADPNDDELVQLQARVRELESQLAALQKDTGDTQDLFRDAVTAGADWFWEMDADLRYTRFFEPEREAQGLPSTDHRGKTREDVRLSAATDDEWVEFQHLLRERRSYRDMLLKREYPDGHTSWYRTSGKPFYDEGGEFRGYRGVGTDITVLVDSERRAVDAQTRLVAAVDSFRESFGLFDSEHRLVICNQAWRDLNAEIPEACEPGITFEEFLHKVVELGMLPEIQGREEEWLKWRLSRGRESDHPFEVQRSNGCWYLIHDQNLPDGGFIIAALDITEHKEAENLKNEFISTVSHEIRTPLTSIRGALGLLKGGVTDSLDKQAAKLVEIAVSNCERLVGLVTHMLDIQRMEAQTFAFATEAVDIREIVSSVIEASELLAEGFDVRMCLDDAASSAVIDGNADRLAQVITNLLSNAVRFSPPGEVVTVGISQNNGSVEVKIADKGPGIAEAFRPHVFEPFARGEQLPDGRDINGSGLGLSISKKIIEEHGGNIGFETTTGAGTAFCISLPSLGNNPG